jgi:hypothetical protein
MKKLKSHNKKNKEEIAKTIEILFDTKNNVPDYLRKMLLERLLWATTENDNDGIYKKYDGQPYWSVGALNKLLDNISNKEKTFHDLRHEHAVPKKEIKEKIENLKNKSTKNILRILNNLGFAVVVTKQEDKKINDTGFRTKMPKQIDLKSNLEIVFSRYIETGIKVCHVGEINLKKIKADDIAKLEKETLT